MTIGQFFLECAVRLGKTQIEFENGYYIVDLIDVLEAQNKYDAQEWLTEIKIETIQYMNPKEQERFLEILQRQAGIETKKNEFDDTGFELLKMKLAGKL